MRRVSASATLPAPPDAVFAFLSELGNLPRWQSGIVSAELLTPAPVRSGSRAHVVRELLGQRVAVDLTLTEYRPGRRLALESAASGIGVRATLDLRPAGEGTDVTFTMQIRARHLLMAPAEGMVAGAAERDIAASLARLREHFEPRNEG
jgi:uncharacterized membrane protein